MASSFWILTYVSQIFFHNAATKKHHSKVSFRKNKSATTEVAAQKTQTPIVAKLTQGENGPKSTYKP